MKLQEFVSETLREIIAGVKEAQEYAGANGAQINPEEGSGIAGKAWVRTPEGGLLAVERVDFNVAVTSIDATQTQAGAGIFVAAFGVGGKGKSDTSSSSVSRINFSVPVVLPRQSKK